MSRTGASHSSHYDRPSSIPWPPILLALVVTGAIALGYLVPLPWPGLNDIAARIVGVAIGCLGIALLVWASWTFHKAKTNVLPHKAADTLLTTGPFARFRNPLYLSDVLILLGVAELTKNVWFAVGALTFGILVTWLAILPEERHLEARFGDAYRDYKARSRRWL